MVYLQRVAHVARLFGTPLVVDNRRPRTIIWRLSARRLGDGLVGQRSVGPPTVAALEDGSNRRIVGFMIVTRGKSRRRVGRHGPDVPDALGSQELHERLIGMAVAEGKIDIKRTLG